MNATHIQWRLWRGSGKWYLPVVFLAVLWAAPAQAQVTDFLHLPWSSTHNCAEQAQGDLYGTTWVTCDNLYKGGGQYSDGGSLGEPCRITTDANMASGGGGRGQRVSQEYDIINPPSKMCGTVTYVLSNPLSELSEVWWRAFIRLEPGWTHLTDQAKGQDDGWKILYIGNCTDSTGKAVAIINGSCIPPAKSTRSLYFILSGYDVHAAYDRGDGGGQTVHTDLGAQNVTGTPMRLFGSGSATTDGSWACHEFHWKKETTNGGTDGVVDYWVNDTNYIHMTGVNFNIGTNTDLNYVLGSMFANGHKYEASPNRRYADVDDVAISNKGRIGCSVSSNPPPPAPSNVTILQ